MTDDPGYRRNTNPRLIAFYSGERRGSATAGVELVPMDRADAFQFDAAPVTAKLVYVTHPRDDGVLVPFGQYEAVILHDKFNEALRIVTSLGAAEITSRSFRGDASNFEARAKFKGKGGGVSGGKTQASDVQYYQKGAGAAPRDPAPLRWPNEPGFEAARLSVLFNGSVYVEITIESQSVYSAKSDLAQGLSKAGFDLGFSGEHNRVTKFQLTATFPAGPGQPAPPPPKHSDEEAPVPDEHRRWWR